MGNLDRVVVSGATALNLLFVGLTTTPNPKYQRRKVDYHHLNHFTRLFPEMVYFQRFTREANN